MRLIDADAYMEKVRHEAKAMPRNEGETFVTLSEWIMEKTPSVEPKQGEWIGDRCSVCGTERAWYGLQPNFCPDCGSKMKGSDDEN